MKLKQQVVEDGKLADAALWRAIRCVTILAVAGMMLLAGCRTAPPFPPVNLSAPGWVTRQGQAVWRQNYKSPEIAGDLLVATRPGGFSYVEFVKTPLPFAVAQTTANAWQIHVIPMNKTYSGHGTPPARIVWLDLVRCLNGQPPPKDWIWELSANDNWQLTNRKTGESLEGYLTK